MLIFKATQEDVLSSIQQVSGIVDRKHTLPVLANLLLRKQGNTLELVSSDLEVQIKTSALLGGQEGNFSTTVECRKLLEILRAMPSNQMVTLTTKENKLVLEGGKSRFTLHTLPAEDFPLVQNASSYGQIFSIPQKTLRAALHQVAFSMAVQDVRYYLNGILFVANGKKLTLVSTDGHRLAYAQADLEVEIPHQEVILPRKTVIELQRLLSDQDGNIDIQFASNQARFQFSGLEFVTKLVEGKFPDYNRVIPSGHKNSLLAGRQVLLSALQRIAIMTSEKFKGVRFNFENDIVRISSNNAEQEEAVEEVEVSYTGDVIETGYNVTYLIDVLNNMSQEMVQIELTDGNSSALVTIPENTNFKYVVMPMRI